MLACNPNAIPNVFVFGSNMGVPNHPMGAGLNW
jgi:hypothetical protein